MFWFKHHNDLLSDSRMQFILDKHGPAGTDAFVRLLEYAAKNLDVEDPGNYTESSRFFFTTIFPKSCRRTAKTICQTFENLRLAEFFFRGKEVIFKVPLIVDLADEYTQKIWNEMKGKKQK